MLVLSLLVVVVVVAAAAGVVPCPVCDCYHPRKRHCVLSDLLVLFVPVQVPVSVSVPGVGPSWQVPCTPLRKDIETPRL